MEYRNREELYEKLNEMRNQDIRQVDPKQVKEMSQLKIDNRLPVKERIRSLLQQVDNPYIYRDRGMLVKISFSENGKTLQSCMEEYLTSEILAE